MRISPATGAAALTVTLALSASSSTAFADWSAPQRLLASGEPVSAVAVDAHGDAAVAWATRYNTDFGPEYRTSIHVTVRTATERVITRTVVDQTRPA